MVSADENVNEPLLEKTWCDKRITTILSFTKVFRKFSYEHIVVLFALCAIISATGFAAGYFIGSHHETSGQEGDISLVPSDVTVLAGETATLTCHVTGSLDEVNSLSWKEFITSASGRTIYQTNQGFLDVADKSKYNVLGENGCFDLNVRDTKLQDGGVYSCGLSLQTTSHEGNLVVLGRPELPFGDIIENKFTLLRCLAQYGGPSPQVIGDQRAKLHMYIERVNGNKETIEGNFTELKTGLPGYNGKEVALWELQFDTNQSFSLPDNGTNITCEIFTETPPGKRSFSRTLNVLYAVRNLQIAPANPYYFPGEYINCTAEGNPTPNVKWEGVDSSGSRPVLDGYLLITADMEGDNKWKCIATNNVKGIHTKELEYEFQVVLPTVGRGASITHVSIMALTSFSFLAYISTY